MSITAVGGRVLGCLVEKELTTPQQYPLTLKALASACSQTTNRSPVMVLDEDSVQATLDDLKELRLVRFVHPSHGRSALRFRHVLDEVYGLDAGGLALLAGLLLRGPQTEGELRARTARLAPFDTADDLRRALRDLAGRPHPLTRLLARQPGQKEDRWQQCVADESGTAERPARPSRPERPGAELATGRASGPAGDTDRIDGRSGAVPAVLEQRVADLSAEVAELAREVGRLAASLAEVRSQLGG